MVNVEYLKSGLTGQPVRHFRGRKLSENSLVFYFFPLFTRTQEEQMNSKLFATTNIKYLMLI